MTLGAYSNGTLGLNGRLDEAALYKRVLTASETSGQGTAIALRLLADGSTESNQ